MSAPAIIDRRRLLLGLAAASTSAATVTATAASAPAENPQLIALMAQLPAIAERYHVLRTAYDAEYAEWDASTPWAPDELTASGTAWPKGYDGQPGEAEEMLLGSYLWRVGDEFPRRIVVKSWHVARRRTASLHKLRRAKKAGNIADCLLLEEEVARLKSLQATAIAYESEYEALQDAAKAWHKPAYHEMDAAKDALEAHIAAIMKTPDWTMEGLVIKAQALAEWNRVGGKYFDRVAYRHGQDWHGQIAASILRHAQGGAA